MKEPQAPQPSTWQENVPQAAATPIYMCEPSVTSVQLKSEHLENLKKNDFYWAQRLKKLHDSHKAIDGVLEEEFNKAVSILYIYLKTNNVTIKLGKSM